MIPAYSDRPHGQALPGRGDAFASHRLAAIAMAVALTVLVLSTTALAIVINTGAGAALPH
jgi:hypothetical protein